MDAGGDDQDVVLVIVCWRVASLSRDRLCSLANHDQSEQFHHFNHPFLDGWHDGGQQR